MREVVVAVESRAREFIEECVDQVDTEIGGLLAVEQDGRVLMVRDAWLVGQEVTGGSVDFDPGEFEAELKKQGVWGKKMPHLCFGIWHSHVNFGTSPSGTDEHKLVRKYASRGWLVNLIVNKKGEWTSLVDSMVGPENGDEEDYALVTVPSRVEFWRPPELEEEVAKGIEALVRKKQPPKVEVKRTDWKGRRWMWEDDKLPTGEREWHYGEDENRNSLLDGTVWTYDKETKSVVEREKKTGKIVTRVADGGRGKVTIYDKNEKPMLLLKNKDAGVKWPKGCLPAEL